ncbi:MAG: hypothetical protein KIS92_25500 [Planctomycetota bacterium]|nr:hypothetical protein [Planctomycetota bacterium]
MRMAAFLGWFGLLAVLATYIFFVYRNRQETGTADIVCLGDSLTACGGPGGRYSDYLAQALPGLKIVNRGIGGDTIAGGRARFERDVLSLQPKVVILELGANDFFQHNRDPKDLYEDMRQMVQTCRNLKMEVILAGVFGEHLSRDGLPGAKEYKEGDPAFGETILRMEQALAKNYNAYHIENIQYDLNTPECWADARHPSAEGNRRVAARMLPVLRAALAQHASAP